MVRDLASPFVDMTPFVDAGFLDPSAPDADTTAMLEYLHGLGVPVDELLAEFHAGDIHSAGVTHLLRDGDLSAAQAAELLDESPDRVLALYRVLGVALPDVHAPRLRRDEVDAMRTLLAASDAMGGEEADEILRVASSALTQVAEAVVATFVGGIDARAADDASIPHLARAQMTQVMAEAGLELGRMLGLLFRYHVWAAVERQRASMAEASNRHTRAMAIGFVDLVGFTPLTSEMSADELVAFVGRFEARSRDIAGAAGGRVVKTIDDEVMVSALTADSGLAIMLALIAEFRASGTTPRGGMAAGAVVSRHGDYFGSIVNLASRLVDEAVPGEVLVDVDSAQQLTATRYEPAGRRSLKGFADPVRVVSVSV